MIDFSDTPMGDKIQERIDLLWKEVEELEEELRLAHREIEQLETEYDMLEEMYDDGLEEEYSRDDEDWFFSPNDGD